MQTTRLVFQSFRSTKQKPKVLDPDVWAQESFVLGKKVRLCGSCAE